MRKSVTSEKIECFIPFQFFVESNRKANDTLLNFSFIFALNIETAHSTVFSSLLLSAIFFCSYAKVHVWNLKVKYSLKWKVSSRIKSIQKSTQCIDTKSEQKSIVLWNIYSIVHSYPCVFLYSRIGNAETRGKTTNVFERIFCSKK